MLEAMRGEISLSGTKITDPYVTRRKNIKISKKGVVNKDDGNVYIHYFFIKII